MAGRKLALVAALIAAWLHAPAFGYEGAIHQQLTFFAARQYNQCVEETSLARLTSLQVRYVAMANANQAEQPWWHRMFRWNYYDRSSQSAGRVMWLLETRMHGSYRESLARFKAARDLSRRFTNLGRLVNHIQDVTTPATVAPVYTARWWRFSVADRFNAFPVDGESLSAALGSDCTAVRAADGTLEKLLVDTAERTLKSITTPIRGMPSDWEAFWELDNDLDEFGRYGDAGNSFGREVRFRCTADESRRCVLLDNDPIYAEYALGRHLDAVKATMAAIAMSVEHVRTVADRVAAAPIDGAVAE